MPDRLQRVDFGRTESPTIRPYPADGGSPAYLERHGVPKSLSALQSHRCSVFRNPGTGKVVPWRVKVGGDVVEQPVAPAICTNDEILEFCAVLPGDVIGQLAGVTAAPYIRSRRLVLLLVDHIPDRYNYFVYFGSRSSQTARAPRSSTLP